MGPSNASKTAASTRGISKAPSGVRGLDAITGGGLPRGRTTLVCGGPGCGKTMFASEFLVNGAVKFDEPGVFIAFEETPTELAQNAASLGHDLDELVARKRLYIDHVRIERGEIVETGDYDLEGLFVRLQYAIDHVGAKRVVLDTLEALFAGLDNEGVLRAELRRLFRWLKDRGMTAIVTAESADGATTRHGLEEFVSDCVIVLDHRVANQVSTRRLRIVKYRGSEHGTNEYPFLIGSTGLRVLPITSLALEHIVSTERVGTGIEPLDAMLDGQGFFRGSTVLLSGTAGTGKTSVASHFAAATCRRGERALYLSFEESESQIIRNQRSIGLDLEPFVAQGLLRYRSIRGAHFGLETHLATIHALVEDWEPSALVLDPITAFTAAGTTLDSHSMLVRLIDYLKVRGVTVMLTDLTNGTDQPVEQTSINVSSIVDTWILLRDIELGGERNRAVYVLKSRGMPHSNQIREFRLQADGFSFRDVYAGPDGVLTGTLRVAQESREAEARRRLAVEVESRRRAVQRRREALEARIDAMRKEFAAEQEELDRGVTEAEQREEESLGEARRIAASRSNRPGHPRESAASEHKVGQ